MANKHPSRIGATSGSRRGGPTAAERQPWAPFEAIANSTIKLARSAPENELAMDLLVADAVLQFGSDLREAREAAAEWARAGR